MADPWAVQSTEPADPWAAVAITPAKAKPKRKRTGWDEAAGAVANIYRGTGVMDELTAGAGALSDMVTGKQKPVGGSVAMAGFNAFGEAFKRNLARQRGIEDDFAEERPKAAAALRGTGMGAAALVPTTKAVSALAEAPRLVNMARGAVSAGVQAAAYAAADRGTGSERLKAASEAGRNPLVLGLGAAAGALAPTAPKAIKPKTPSLDELRAAKTAAYDEVGAAGIRYKPSFVDKVVSDVSKDAASKNINAVRHPKAWSMLQDLQAMKGQSPTLTELDQLRQVIRRDVASAPDEAEKFFGKRMIAKLDELITAAGPKDVITGNATDATAMLGKARDLNTRVRKIEAIEEGLEEATYRAGKTGSGGNVNNAIRQEMDKVRKATPNLTDEEAAMLEKIIIGSKGQNALRQVGKLSPQGNGLMTALSIGGAAANPLLAIPTAAGALSKVAADRMTQRNVAKLVEEIARGGSPAAKQALTVAAQSDPALAAMLQQVSARLSRAVGVGGGALASGAAAPSALSASNQ